MAHRIAACLAVLVSTSAHSQVWETRAPYPEAATEVSAAAIGSKVYVVCGITPRGSRNTLFAYDTVRDDWEELAAAPLPSAAGDHCNVAAVNGKLYLLGALNLGAGTIDGGTHVYDPVTGRWETIARMPTARGASGVAAIGGKIYVAGGLGGNSAEFEMFDTGTRQWSRLPAMPSARDHLTAQAIDGKFYALAGRNGSRLVADAEEFDPAVNQWRRRAPIPTPRGGVASGVIGGRILVFGGEGPSGTPERTYPQNEAYDPATDRWASLPPLPTPRHGFYGATVDDRVFLAAGGPREGATYSTAHEVFMLPPSSPPRVAPENVRSAARLDGAIALGGLVSLFGERLSLGEQVATRPTLPRRMNGVTVTVDGQAAPLLYLGPRQINLQLPGSQPPGRVRIVVINAGSASEEIVTQAAAIAPGIFSLDGSGQGQGAVLVAGTGLIARATRDAFSRAPRRGEVVEIYCDSLGPLSDPPSLGEPASANPLSRTLETPRVSIGGEPAEVLFSGLTPGLVGVYQVNARIAANARTGIAVPVEVRVGGLASNAVTIAVVE